MKSYNGRKDRIIIRRLKCTNKSCNTLHNELPDCLVPFKHYCSEVIENVVDEVSTPEDLTTEDYPCELTMKRWKQWFERIAVQIDGILKSQISRLFQFAESIIHSADSLLSSLRNGDNGWLSIVTRIVCNSSNLSILLNAPALMCVPADNSVSSSRMEEIHNEQRLHGSGSSEEVQHDCTSDNFRQ